MATADRAKKVNKGNDGNNGNDDHDHGPAWHQYGRDRVTICHRSASGQEHTLVLPRVAAFAHLLIHRRDSLGPC